MSSYSSMLSTLRSASPRITIPAAALLTTSIIYFSFFRASSQQSTVPKSKPTSVWYTDLITSSRTVHSLHGREIGISEYGSQSPDARLCLFFHGLPGSRIIPVEGLRELCFKHNVRLVAIDRPGIGLTDAVDGDNDTTWAVASQDVLDVISALTSEGNQEQGKETSQLVSVIGYSMGAPHALHFASNNAARVSSLHMVAPAHHVYPAPDYAHLAQAFPKIAPTSADDTLTPPNRAAHLMAAWAPRFLRTMWTLLASQIVAGDTYAESVLAATSPRDRDEHLSAAERELWKITTHETFRQGLGGFLKAVLETFGKATPRGWGWDVEESGERLRKAGVEIKWWCARVDGFTPLGGCLGLVQSVEGTEKSGLEERIKIYEDGMGHLGVLGAALNDVVRSEGVEPS